MTTAVSALEPFVSIGNTRTVSEVTHAFSMRALGTDRRVGSENRSADHRQNKLSVRIIRHPECYKIGALDSDV